ncbi:hypothetical protein VTK56DRAFT_9733 [Thermocarpiscus australiensis]
MSTTQKPTLVVFDLLTALLDSWTAWDTAVSTALSQPPTEEPGTLSPPSTQQKQCDKPPAQSLGRAWRQTYLTSPTPRDPTSPTPTSCTRPRPSPRTRPGPRRVSSSPTTPHGSDRGPKCPMYYARCARVATSSPIATNCSAELGHAAAALLGEQVFDVVVVTAEESGWYKPAREAYRTMLRRPGVPAGETLFVVGSAADVPGAAGAGLRAVWHNRVGMQAKGG